LEHLSTWGTVMSFADELLAASRDESLSLALARLLLQRAAVCIRSTEFGMEQTCVDIINGLRTAPSDKSLQANDSLKAWLADHGETPLDGLNEDTETKGNA
jgi:hypothetical protein